MYFIDFMLILLGLIILVIGILISVAYLTLLERKVLGYIQLRKGPNKVGFMGLLQPFCEALKLFSKELVYPYMSNYIIYYISPLMSFFISLFLWTLMPYFFNMISFDLGMLFFFCCTSLGVYMIMMSGWSSNSIYAMLGSMRAVAQTISYEVSMILIMLSSVLLMMEFNLFMFKEFQLLSWFMMLLFPLSMVIFVTLLAETNRSPFDFAEGESELVSGFNIEYGAGGFTLIFLAEYSMILFMSLIFVLMFMGGYSMNILFYLKLIFLSFVFIWVRGSLPRYRYDKLMMLAWKIYLPLSLNFFMFIMLVKVYLFYMIFLV